jgi:hypothetical protein
VLSGRRQGQPVLREAGSRGRHPPPADALSRMVWR